MDGLYLMLRYTPTLVRSISKRPHSTSSLSTAYLNSKINGYIHEGRLIDAINMFEENLHNRDVVSWNLMISGYVRNGQIKCAEKLFDEMPHKDIVSWNAMLSAFRQNGDSNSMILHFLQMGRIGLKPNAFTLTTLIAAVPDKVLIPQLHAYAIHMAFHSNTFTGTALIGGYTNLGDPLGLQRIFDEILMKNLVSWTALIIGYMELGCVADARRAFEMMPERNVVAWTAMVNGYSINGNLDEARLLFDRMPQRNVVSWTSMIKGCERNGQFLGALDLFLQMCRSSGIRPNQFTYSAVLSACAGCCSLVIGKLVHTSILKSGLPADVILLGSLIEMYGKCGDVDAAIRVFESIEKNNLVSWNSIIGCCARNGRPDRALEEFERMKEDGVRPDHITFVGVLTACARGGLVEQGERYFKSMEWEFAVRARMEHYACMVDLFGRAGQLEKAEGLIKGMPFEPDIVVWGALVGACGLHSSLEHGLFATESMCKLEYKHPAIYSMLLRIHGERGAWNRVDELKKMMEEVGIRKQKGTSWIESQSSIAR